MHRESARRSRGRGFDREWDRRRFHAASARSAANGRVRRTRKSIRNSESPKLCSKSPAESMPAVAPRAVAARKRVAAGAHLVPEIPRHHADEPEPDSERRQAALGGNLHRHIVQMRVDLFNGQRIAVLRIYPLDHVWSDACERMVRDHRAPFLQHRDAVARCRIVHVEHRVTSAR